MAGTIHIRPARADERHVLEALQLRASLRNREDRPHLLSNPDSIVLPHEQIKSGRVRVAERGASRLPPRPPALRRRCRVGWLFLEPDHCGEGIGRMLVEDAIRAAISLRAKTLHVTANPHALGFHAACGFVRDGETETQFGPAPTLRLALPR